MKQENREPSRNTPPHAKLSEAFKANKLGMSSQKNLLIGLITDKNNVNVRFFILNSLNHGRGSLIPLTDRVSVWVATMTRKIRSSVQLFAQAHPFRESL